MLDPLHPLLVMLHEAEATLHAAADAGRELRVPTPNASTALTIIQPLPRHPIPTEEAPAAALAAAHPEMTLTAGVIVAIGVLGPLGFLYRRSRSLAQTPPPAKPPIS
jgi:hypothetical protein